MGEADKRTAVVMVGPTAVGKTAVAEALAGRLPIQVISADSRQIYRGLDIGTAKPSDETLRRIPHLGIDVVDPGERYSAGRFAADATSWIEAVPSTVLPVVVGGTGFYVRALADGLFREPPMDRARRERLREWAQTEDQLGRWAARLDPEFAGGGRQRAARTIEVALLTGRPLSWWQQHAREQGTVQPWYVRLSVPRAVLHDRIARRTREMLDAGWIEEVEGLLARGISPSAPGLDAVGYRDVVRYLNGQLDRDGLEQAIVVGTRRYAKRQETWFRHQLRGPVLSLDATGSASETAGQIVERWEETHG